MLRLFTTIYDEKNSVRRDEYIKCLSLMKSCESIGEVFVLCEGGKNMKPFGKNVNVVKIKSRPKYMDYFNVMKEIVKYNDISIIANTDIYFDKQLMIFENWEMSDNVVFALSRWDINSSGIPVLHNRNDSQDAWVFRGPLKKVDGDFPVGVPRCDNRFLYELQKAGYEVINPAFSVRAYHLHAGPRTEYPSENLEYFVAPPYAYLWPHNLWSLPRTLFYNLCHPSAPVSWQFDRRKFNGSLPVRAFRKVLHSFRSWL